jgi:hypothetical protein
MLAYIDKNEWLSIPISLLNLWFLPAEKLPGLHRFITSFDPAWDWIWKRYADETYGLYGERTAEFLNHKLLQPNKRYYSLLYYSNIHSKLPDGYMIFRGARNFTKDLIILKICDYGGSQKAKQYLFGLYAPQQSTEYGIVALGGVEDKPLFRKAGLWLSKPYPIATDKSITEKMHVTFFDSDLDNLW